MPNAIPTDRIPRTTSLPAPRAGRPADAPVLSASRGTIATRPPVASSEKDTEGACGWGDSLPHDRDTEGGTGRGVPIGGEAGPPGGGGPAAASSCDLPAKRGVNEAEDGPQFAFDPLGQIEGIQTVEELVEFVAPLRRESRAVP